MTFTKPDSDRPKVRPDVVSATREKLTVLLDLESAQYYQLNEIGARIWTMLCDDLSVEEIVTDLVAHYDASVDTIRNDVDSLLASMRGAGLIVC